MFWYPLSNKSSIIAVIAWISLILIDILFLIYAFYKFANVLSDHRKSAILRRPAKPKTSSSFAHQSIDRASVETRTTNGDDTINNINHSKDEFETIQENNNVVEENITNDNDVIEQITTDDHKGKKDKQTNEESSVHPCNDSTRCDATRMNDVRRTRSRAVPNFNYEDIKFTNVFLLARLKRNLQFLFLILFVTIVGQGAAAALSFASAIDYTILRGDDSEAIHVVVFISASIVEPIISLIICNTTSTLRLALQSTTRRIFFACRISK